MKCPNYLKICRYDVSGHNYRSEIIKTNPNKNQRSLEDALSDCYADTICVEVKIIPCLVDMSGTIVLCPDTFTFRNLNPQKLL